MPRPDPLPAAYRRRLEAIRAEILRRLAALYRDEVDPDAIKDSLEQWIDRAAPVLEAGQASIAALAEAYLVGRAAAAGISLDFGTTTAEIAGTTRLGNSVVEALRAIGPMILGQIAAGHPVDQAIEYGSFTIERFADNELTAVEDRVQEDPAAQTRLSGWDCTVSPTACDACLENAGSHELTWRPYRHGNCACVVEAAFSAVA